MRNLGLVLIFGSCVAAIVPAHANSVGGAVLPNADIRALEPPIDVTEEQLRAQGTPVPPAVAPMPRHKRKSHRR